MKEKEKPQVAVIKDLKIKLFPDKFVQADVQNDMSIV